MVNDYPLVTVVIPCYNHQNYVIDSIKSVISQDYHNIELIIIDDGSSDESVKAIETCIDECESRFTRFRFYSRKNKGLSSTLNEMLEWSKGKYFCGLGSDDILLSNKISGQVAFFEENPDCEILSAYVNHIDEKGNCIKQEERLEFKKFSFTDVLQQSYYIPAPTIMYKTATLKTIGYNPDFVLEDWFMLLSILKKGGQAVLLPTVNVLYRIHPHNTHGKLKLMYTEQVKVIEYFKKDIPIKNYREIWGKVLLTYIIKLLKRDKYKSFGVLKKTFSENKGFKLRVIFSYLFSKVFFSRVKEILKI